MGVKNRFSLQQFILSGGPMPSRQEYKRLVLTTYFSFLCLGVISIYTVLDITNGVFYSFPSYIGLLITSLSSLYLIKIKKHKASKILLMVSANLAIFWAAINDPFETGSFMLFIPAGIGSFAVLAFHDLKTGIALAIFTTLLFLIAYLGNFELHTTTLTESYVQVSFVMNYVISMTISVLIVYFLMSLNSMSEDELMQKERFAQEKNLELQKVNDELDRFVYSVSHDLRSPLSSILGLTNLARMTKDPKEVDEILNLIQGRVTAQDHFIREIIDYSRNARSETKLEAININKLVDEILEGLKYNTNAYNITFRKSIKSDAHVCTDRIRLSIVLNNLIGNAIKYHDLKKNEPFIEVGLDERNSSLYVRDNGSGIHEDHLEKIFDMFYRGSEGSTGSGLGLFISKEAVTKINGKILVESEHGEGSTFFIQLPPNSISINRNNS